MALTKQTYWIIYSRVKNAILSNPFLSKEKAQQELDKYNVRFPHNDYKLEEHTRMIDVESGSNDEFEKF
jgi:hypothetical protein